MRFIVLSDTIKDFIAEQVRDVLQAEGAESVETIQDEFRLGYCRALSAVYFKFCGCEDVKYTET